MIKHRRVVGSVLTALGLGWMLVYASVVRDWIGVLLAGGFLAVVLTIAQRREGKVEDR